jgi:hypothetical protein
MAAMLLKDEDGGFDYVSAMVALFLCWVIIYSIVHASKSLTTGRILFGSKHSVYWVYRNSDPRLFWLSFIIHCLGALLCFCLIIMVCFGLGRKKW